MVFGASAAGPFPERTKAEFPWPWNEVRKHFDEVEEAILSHKLDWERLAEVGLAGDSLRHKHELFSLSTGYISLEFDEREANRFSPEKGLAEGLKKVIFGKNGKPVIGRSLKLANSFLGSLSRVIPGVDFIKEYKDTAEISISV